MKKVCKNPNKYKYWQKCRKKETQRRIKILTHYSGYRCNRMFLYDMLEKTLEDTFLSDFDIIKIK